MQELIEKIVGIVKDNIYGEDWGIHSSELRRELSELLPSATILPLQFKDGEPEEDGEYLVIFQDGEEKMYMCIEYCTTDTYRFPILQHAKLPE